MAAMSPSHTESGLCGPMPTALSTALPQHVAPSLRIGSSAWQAPLDGRGLCPSHRKPEAVVLALGTKMKMPSPWCYHNDMHKHIHNA
eukprot:CAMPEP_0174365726 /NCGR_PEP_ID=MMETSP0811_2-20130205/78260_1 /TAXON_ID=73025 ORGANISM="Eutreptiella gymnastica-like, Strain CCMP1594" /NCGR_SAMPLE_ID=MMETSP0811_2 /ASSEMBLY_ACC=CAM_ASM_000667 /LENGTH=86 /DNA_ID=CAMNT_0015506599 /DNA_START=373 /DNA_END=633 /DNA_ORIENTATION=+